jgi:hypothetical protein
VNLAGVRWAARKPDATGPGSHMLPGRCLSTISAMRQRPGARVRPALR